MLGIERIKILGSEVKDKALLKVIKKLMNIVSVHIVKKQI